MAKLLRTYIVALIAVLAMAAPVHSTSMTLTGAGCAGVCGGGSATWTPTTPPAALNVAFGNCTAGAPCTFSSVPFGPAASNRVAVVCFVHGNSGSRIVTDVKIGGTSATLFYTSTDGIGIAYLPLASGTTANVDFVMNFGPNWLEILPGYVTTSTPTPSATNRDPSSNVADPQVMPSSVTVPSNGVGVVCGGSTPLSCPVVQTWSGNTFAAGDTDSCSSGNIYSVRSHAAAAGSWTPSLTGTPPPANGFGFAGWAAVEAVWSP